MGLIDHFSSRNIDPIDIPCGLYVGVQALVRKVFATFGGTRIGDH